MGTQEDMKTLEGDYEKTTEELEMVEEEVRESEAKRVALTDELDELREEYIKLKVEKETHVITLSSITLSNIALSNVTLSNITLSNITLSNITLSNITHSIITHSIITHHSLHIESDPRRVLFSAHFSDHVI